uniref:Uncharacterized protein n=1 Tax=Arundo donax TaxID=35708 RepID=A0A0A9BNS2_ARUDO
MCLELDQESFVVWHNKSIVHLDSSFFHLSFFISSPVYWEAIFINDSLIT